MRWKPQFVQGERVCAGERGGGAGQLGEIPLRSVWGSPACCSVTGRNCPTALRPTAGHPPGLLQPPARRHPEGPGQQRRSRGSRRGFVLAGLAQTTPPEPVWRGGMRAAPWMDELCLRAVQQLRG